MGFGREDSVMTDSALRELYAGRVVRRPDSRAHCPDPEALQALVRREGPEEARLRTLDHVMACAACRPEFDLLRSVEDAGRRLGATGSASRRSWLMPAALAAALLLAVGLGRWSVGSGGEDDVVRGGPAAGTVQLLTPPVQATAGDSLLFSWQPVPGATRYHLEVLDSAGEVAFQTETADTLISPQQARGLAPGAYQWWVSTLGTPSPRRSELRPLRLTK
jgi:hypothetical protein